jgi:hypothetical protein
LTRDSGINLMNGEWHTLLNDRVLEKAEDELGNKWLMKPNRIVVEIGIEIMRESRLAITLY